MLGYCPLPDAAFSVINYCHHEDEALELEKYIRDNYDVDVMVVKCDVSKEEEVEEMVNNVVDYFGRIDILVNNASVCRDSLLLDKSIKEFRRVLDVNLIGTYLCSKYVGRVMLENKKGKIINPDEVAMAIAKTINDAEEEANLRINSAYVTIPGKYVTIVQNSVVKEIKDKFAGISSKDINSALMLFLNQQM